MLRVLVMAVILLANTVLQASAFPYIEILSVKPNTAILIIVSYAVLRNDIEGAIVGFFAGLLQDMFFGDYLGLYAFLGMCTGYLCGKPFKNFFKENYIPPLLLCAASLFAYEFAVYVFRFLLQGKIDIWFYFRTIILPEAIYSIILSLPIYRLLYSLNKCLEAHTRKKRSH